MCILLESEFEITRHELLHIIPSSVESMHTFSSSEVDLSFGFDFDRFLLFVILDSEG